MRAPFKTAASFQQRLGPRWKRWEALLVILAINAAAVYWLLEAGPARPTAQPNAGAIDRNEQPEGINHRDDAAVKVTDKDEAKESKRTYMSTLTTSQGAIGIEFLPEAAPLTVANYVKLLRMGFYNDNLTAMYRYEANFCLQGGGWPRKASPLPPVPLEYKLPNKKYFISTARTADPDSATCEFSIMINDNSEGLAPSIGPNGEQRHGYAVFAKIISGFDVVDSFASLKVDRRSGMAKLDPPVQIFSWNMDSLPTSDE